MYFRFNVSTRTQHHTDRGFGLVELMVSISIMMLLSAVIMTRHSAFSGAVVLRNQAYDIAFAIRKAQLLAVSGTNNGSATSTQQYGVYFDTSTGNNQLYFIFHDINGDGQWNSGDVKVGAGEHVDSRFAIRRISFTNGNNFSSTDGFNITFIRPNFDAKFKDNDDTSYKLSSTAYVDVSAIEAATNFGDRSLNSVRRVLVTSTGQISVTSF